MTFFNTVIKLQANPDTIKEASTPECPDSPNTQNSIPSDSVENKEIMGVENNTKT